VQLLPLPNPSLDNVKLPTCLTISESVMPLSCQLISNILRAVAILSIAWGGENNLHLIYPVGSEGVGHELAQHPIF
jgi:hypothetical protein